jgi:hypothetical protein
VSRGNRKSTSLWKFFHFFFLLINILSVSALSSTISSLSLHSSCGVVGGRPTSLSCRAALA